MLLLQSLQFQAPRARSGTRGLLQQRGSVLCGTGVALRFVPAHTLKQQVRGATTVDIYLARAAHPTPSDVYYLSCALQDVRVRPFQQLRSWTKGLPKQHR